MLYRSSSFRRPRLSRSNLALQRFFFVLLARQAGFRMRGRGARTTYDRQHTRSREYTYAVANVVPRMCVHQIAERRNSFVD